MTDKEKEAIKRMTEVRDKNVHTFVDELTTVLNLIQTQQAEIEQLKNKNKHQSKEMQKAVDYTFELNKEIEKKDNKLKDIKNHIKAELKMIDKSYNEVGWAGKEQYDGMKAAYKCLLNIYFENEVETEEK